MDKPTSYFEKVVCLRSWWLGYSENGLYVAGFSNREKEARRVFISAPILKRHDDFNLETVDGISVKLHGFIDKPRTEANGFWSEIFQHFLFGFPAWWEECAKKCVKKEYTTELITKNNARIEAASPQEQGESKSATINENLSTRDAEKNLAHVNESTPIRDTVPIVFAEAASFRKSQSEHETADEDILPERLVSSNADNNQYLSGENIRSNHSSGSNIERQDGKQAETTAKTKAHKRTKKRAQASKSAKNDMTSAGKRKRSATANMNLSRREAEKKLAHVNESTPVHHTVPIVFPEAASSRRSLSEHETTDADILPGGLDSSNADNDKYLSGENVRSNHSSDSNVERQDPKQAETMVKPKGHKVSNKSKSVKNYMTNAGKRKKSATANVNLSGREADKKLAHVNENTPVQHKVPILSPEAASFRRSRSGRLLLPALEYWHNQRAVYDVDRKIIRVEGVLDH